MYPHPEDPTVLGRPFSGLLTHQHILDAYLAVPPIVLDPENPNLTPQLVTGISENHFDEHTVTINTVFDNHPGQNIIIYDLGLTAKQKNHFKADDRFIFKRFPFKKYPKKMVWLTGMSWKILAWMDCLMEYGACQWFDASIKFESSPKLIIEEYIYARNSSFVYYIHPAPHNAPWATHPIMFSYLPSNITKLNQKTANMCQSGAVLMYNTVEFQQKAMKYAIGCALTPECMFPNYELSERRTDIMNERMAEKSNPWGSFEHKHCPGFSKAPWNKPFNCHRYDQSLMAILISNMYDHDYSMYRPMWSEVIGVTDRRSAAEVDKDFGKRRIWNETEDGDKVLVREIGEKVKN